jgi:hypothetical protein
MSRRASLTAAAAALVAATTFAGFAGTDLFLPMAGRQAGVHPSNWYTTVWVHNPGAEAATARVYFLQRGTANPSPPWVDVMIEPGDTEKLENVVETYFRLETFGALRVTCDTQRLVVTSRVFSQAVGTDAADSVGQDFAGVPASFAIGLGEKSQVLGVHQTLPAADSELRFNFGLVETTGHSATVRVRAFDENGDDKGFTDVNVRELSQRQVAFKDHFPTVSGESFRLELEVISGSGRVIAYGSGIANGSQDPTTFEMAYADSLLGAGTISGVTAGDGLTGGGVDGAVSLAVGAGDGITVTADTVGIADGGVMTPKLAAAAVTPDRIAPSATVGQVLTTVAAGSAAPLEAMSFAGNAVAWQTPTYGDITAVNTPAGSGLTGGVASGDANLAIAPNSVVTAMLADNAVIASKIANGAVDGAAIADGSVAADDAAFTYAGSQSKGGPASDLSCADCVGTDELSISGAGSGQVLKFNGSGVAWSNDSLGDLTLPYLGEVTTSSDGLRIIQRGTGTGIRIQAAAGLAIDASGVDNVGGGIYGLCSNNPAIHGASDASYGVWGFSTYSDGVFAESYNNGNGVRATSYNGYGVRASSEHSDGVFGESSGSASDAGVYGTHSGAGRGVEGLSNAGYGVYGRTATGSGVRGYASEDAGYAGYFVGRTHVNGALSKSSGSFTIDHPLDPANRYLSHSFVESPDMMNVYNGNVVTDATGEAVVELPEWFEALNRDFRYQLTPVGGPGPNLHVAAKILNGRFRIAGATPGLEVSWQVTGIRQDPWAQEHPIVVEEDKPEGERGYYLHPELYGLDETASTNAMTRAEAGAAAEEAAAAGREPN